MIMLLPFDWFNNIEDIDLLEEERCGSDFRYPQFAKAVRRH
jgi:hypothetical protein